MQGGYGNSLVLEDINLPQQLWQIHLVEVTQSNPF